MITVIIPALNEEKTIREVISLVSSSPQVDEILLLMIKSADNTIKRRVTQSKDITSPKLGERMSKREGFSVENEVVVLLDADILSYPKIL
jgi:glycosyltransferase involved in cell wall biosynthesis